MLRSHISVARRTVGSKARLAAIHAASTSARRRDAMSCSLKSHALAESCVMTIVERLRNIADQLDMQQATLRDAARDLSAVLYFLLELHLREAHTD